LDDNEQYYKMPQLLILLYISGGLLYGSLCTMVFTLIKAAAILIPPLERWAAVVFIALLCAGVLFTVIMTISILIRREIIPIIPTRKLWMRYLVRVSQSVAKRIFMDSDRAVRSFIQLSNEFVMKSMKGQAAKRVLFLLPHCIQLNSCSFKITSDINNCRKCGKCVVSSFIELSERFGFDVHVSTGGTQARLVVKDKMPDLILAVACERDLLSGIRDTLMFPVIGILNSRPNGPCYNTTVDPQAVETVLNKVFAQG
jgi:hypothetical protein